MADPTPDEAAAELQAILDVLDAGGRHCGCDPDLYGDSDFIGVVSDSQGNGHREVRGAAIRVLLAERDRLRAENKLLLAILHSYQPDACSRSTAHPPHDWLRSRHAAHCPGLGVHAEPPPPVDLLAPNSVLLAEVRQLRRDLARARSDRDSWQELAAAREAAARTPDGESGEP